MKIDPRFVAFLKRQNISRVVATYSGQGDSGEIDEIVFFRGDKQSEELQFDPEAKELTNPGDRYQYQPDFKYDPDSFFGDFVEAVLEELYPGWEINDGASGNLSFDVESGKIELEHISYYTDSLTDSYSYKVDDNGELTDSHAS